jgi:hypothetical protein
MAKGGGRNGVYQWCLNFKLIANSEKPDDDAMVVEEGKSDSPSYINDNNDDWSGVDYDNDGDEEYVYDEKAIGYSGHSTSF